MEINVLLVEPNNQTADILVKNFENEFAFKVTHCNDSARGLEAIKDNVFELVVVRSQPADGSANWGNLFLNYIYDNQLKTGLVILGESENSSNRLAVVVEKLTIPELNRASLKALNMKREDFLHVKLPDYLPFPVKHFYLMNQSPCDIFIKIVKKTGDEYLKRLNAGEAFTKVDLLKYEELGLKDFYVAKDDREAFMNGFLLQTIKSLRTADGVEGTVTKLGDSFVLSSNLILALGITPECIALVDNTVKLMNGQIVKTDKLGILLKKLLDNQLSYSYRRSYLISLISYMLLPRMEWGTVEQMPSLMEKITMVSFFHDIYLEDEKCLKVMDQAGLKKANLQPRQRDAVLNHAHQAALLVQPYPRLPQGVDLIIKQHHGVSNGVGFPEVYTTAISPMAIFFIVVESFVTHLLENTEAPNLPEIAKKLHVQFSLPTYRKIVQEIEHTFHIKQS